MEAVAAAASILAIAGAGIQVSLRLIAFADQVGTAAQRIQDVGTDVSVTAGTLQQLGELMKKNPSTKKSAGLFHPDQVQNIDFLSKRCEDLFDNLNDILGKASQQLRDVYKSNVKSHGTPPKIKLSTFERLKWPFLQPSMGSLQSALRDAKGTLTLILQVVHLRHAQTTASLGPEEQEDLIQMIAAMRRQQLASADGDQGGYKGLDVGETEDSDSGNSSKTRTALEAWSVTPNTFSDEGFQHFLITQIPVSQQQIGNILRSSPQDFREIASMIDGFSHPEREAVFGEVLGMRHYRADDSTIRSISSQSWTGSHDLFGKVSGRKFKVVIERRSRISKFSRTNIRHRAFVHRERADVHLKPEAHHYSSNSNISVHDSFSDSDNIHETEECRRHRHRRRRPSAFERRRPVSDDNPRRKQEIEEKERMKERMHRKARVEKEDMVNQDRWGSPDSRPWTPQPASESSDQALVESLLAQYTNFKPGEPLVQGIATPPPSYDETFVIPRRVPRPY